MPHDEWVKTIVGVTTSTLGFLIALLVNSYLELRRDKKTHRTMLKVIKVEASSNKIILKDSFWKYYRDGVVLREFFLEAATQCCASPLFIKHAELNGIGILNAYLRNLKLANGYREKAESFLLDAKGRASQEWLPTLRNSWEENLKLCDESIEKVVALTEK